MSTLAAPLEETLETPRQRPWPRRIRRLVLGLALAWLAFCVAHMVLSGRWSMWVVPGLVPPIVFVALPLLLLLLGTAARGRRAQVMALSLLAALITTSYNGLNYWALLPAPDPVAGMPVRIVTQNTDYWAQARGGIWSTKRDRNSLFRHLRTLDADVYLLQEHMLRIDNRPVPITDTSDVEAAFPGYHMVARGTLLTLSRLPVEDVSVIEALDMPKLQFPAPYGLRVDVRAGGRTLSTYNVHMPVQLLLEASPRSSQFYREIQLRQERRGREFKALTAAVKANANPLFIGGDFNTSPAMGDLNGLRGVTDDAIRASRSLYPVSWREGGHVPKLWRNDWALIRGDVHLNRYDFPSSEGNSDHTSQRIDLVLPHEEEKR